MVLMKSENNIKQSYTIDDKRAAILKVKEILEPFGDFIVVLEGASATSYTHDGLIKDMREMLINHEKQIGEDPYHDWTKDD